jgi:murein DD-endopeptidase MepM/ murein hydrolase activator NlpD
MSKKHKARSKVTQKLTRDGAVRRDEVTGAEERISKRSADFDLRGAKTDEQTLYRTDTRFDGKKSARHKNRAAYKQAQERLRDAHTPETAEVTEAKPDNPPQFSEEAAKPEQIVSAEIPDTPLSDERTSLNQEHSNQKNPPSVKSKPPPGKEQRYYQQFTEPQTADTPALRQNAAPPPIIEPNPQPEQSEVSDTQSETAPKLQTERESKLNTDGNSALRFTHGELPLTSGKSKRRYNQSTQSAANGNTPALPKQAEQQSEHHSGETFQEPADAPIGDTSARPAQQPQQHEAETVDADTAGVDAQGEPAATDAPRKESDSPLKQSKDSKLQFAPDETPPLRAEAKQQQKYGKAQAKADKSVKKLETAKSKLPAKKNLRSERVFDEETGKAKRKLYFESEVKSQGEHLKGAKPLRPVKAAGNSALAFGHRKMYQVERENVATEAAHKGEIAAEGVVRSALRHHKTAPYHKVEKLQRKATKKSINAAYQKALAENPKLKSNLLSRAFQKRKIKKDYAKAACEAKKTAERAKKAGGVIADAGKALVGVVKRHPVATAVVVLIALLLFALMSLIGAFGGMGSGGLSGILTASYLAEDADIDNAELSYTEWETDLQMQIANVETTHSGYDEYRYSVGDISHNPYELMAYLTVNYQNFSNATAQAELSALFAEQYTLMFTPTTETRYADPSDADGDGDYEPYDWNVLTVTLTARNFSDVVAARLSGEQLAHYALLLQTKGARQYLANPFGDMNWLPYVTSYYGYRVHPISGEKNYHKGIDIGLPQGTEIHAGQDGTVSVGYDAGGYGNYVTITGADGLVSKYAHCDSVLVSDGQTVKAGDVIATVGNTGNSTGAHLHLEIIKNGQYLNPAYFCDTGSFNLTPDYGNPGTPMGDGTYAALIAEAERHLGKPYIFGASGPDAFDCSGLICYVYRNAGVYDFGRVGATSIYNQCNPVSPDEARPGDVVTFHSTYSAPNPITHIGIFVGYVNGRPLMLHSGSPCQYTYIDTPYWQQHFYGFARIPE